MIPRTYVAVSLRGPLHFKLSFEIQNLVPFLGYLPIFQAKATNGLARDNSEQLNSTVYESCIKFLNIQCNITSLPVAPPLGHTLR